MLLFYFLVGLFSFIFPSISPSALMSLDVHPAGNSIFSALLRSLRLWFQMRKMSVVGDWGWWGSVPFPLWLLISSCLKSTVYGGVRLFSCPVTNISCKHLMRFHEKEPLGEPIWVAWITSSSSSVLSQPSPSAYLVSPGRGLSISDYSSYPDDVKKSCDFFSWSRFFSLLVLDPCFSHLSSSQWRRNSFRFLSPQIILQ